MIRAASPGAAGARPPGQPAGRSRGPRCDLGSPPRCAATAGRRHRSRRELSAPQRRLTRRCRTSRCARCSFNGWRRDDLVTAEEILATENRRHRLWRGLVGQVPSRAAANSPTHESVTGSEMAAGHAVGAAEVAAIGERDARGGAPTAHPEGGRAGRLPRLAQLRLPDPGPAPRAGASGRRRRAWEISARVIRVLPQGPGSSWSSRRRDAGAAGSAVPPICLRRSAS